MLLVLGVRSSVGNLTVPLISLLHGTLNSEWERDRARAWGAHVDHNPPLVFTPGNRPPTCSALPGFTDLSATAAVTGNGGAPFFVWPLIRPGRGFSTRSFAPYGASISAPAIYTLAAAAVAEAAFALAVTFHFGEREVTAVVGLAVCR